MILVTGGCGYIGSHTVLALYKSGVRELVVVDNLSNSKKEVLEKLQILAPDLKIHFLQADVREEETMDRLFSEYPIETVIHFAGYKAVGESVQKPLEYYDNNLNSTLVLLKIMEKHQTKEFVFSSSATVYGADNQVPYEEEMRTSATNPYGWTKVMQEQILKDEAAAHPEMRIALLRYFNPIGADESGLIGENPNGIPNNLLPYVARVAAGTLEKVSVFGNDYDTPDGTGVRDYIHVADLSLGHVQALSYIHDHPGVSVFNLGTGKGHSVLEIVEAYRKVSGKEIPYVITERRPGDLSWSYANVDKAEKLLGFKAEKTLDEMCKDSWNFTKKSKQ